MPVYMQVCAGVSMFWLSSQLLESMRLMGLTCVLRCFQYKRAAGSWPLVGTCPAFHLQGHCQEHPVDLTVDDGDEQPKLSRAKKCWVQTTRCHIFVEEAHCAPKM